MAFGAGSEFNGGTADNNDFTSLGMLALISASADGFGDAVFRGPAVGAGSPQGALNLAFSGTVSADAYPSYLNVVLTGSEAVYIKLPNGDLGAGDAGLMLTIKKQGSGEGPLIITGSSATVAGIFDVGASGGLHEITASSPMAAINLMWNGSSYDLY